MRYGKEVLGVDFPSTIWVGIDSQTAAQTSRQLVATPGTGRNLFITDIIISNQGTPGSVTLVEDCSGTPKNISLPIYMGLSTGFAKRFRTPIKATADKNVGYTSVGVATHGVQINGFTL